MRPAACEPSTLFSGPSSTVSLRLGESAGSRRTACSTSKPMGSQASLTTAELTLPASACRAETEAHGPGNADDLSSSSSVSTGSSLTLADAVQVSGHSAPVTMSVSVAPPRKRHSSRLGRHGAPPISSVLASCLECLVQCLLHCVLVAYKRLEPQEQWMQAISSPAVEESQVSQEHK